MEEDTITISTNTTSDTTLGYDLSEYTVDTIDISSITTSTVDSNLTDKLVKGLGVKFLSDWTNTGLAGLALLKALVQFFLQLNDVHLGGRGREHGLDPELLLVHSVFSGRQDGV